MEQEEKLITNMCRKFANAADELETKGFGNLEYKEVGFVNDFNELFDKYAYGKQNRTISGLNFRQPPRYANINSSKNEIVKQLSKTRYRVTFEPEQKWKSLRFLVDKKQKEWKITRYETFIGIANHGKNKGEEIWRKNKL